MQIKKSVQFFLFAAILERYELDEACIEWKCAPRDVSRATRSGPQKPPFLACQKVAPPPCKKPPFLHFPRRKVGIFDQFVHENAHFWHTFCGHSSRPRRSVSVGKKPANLYSTKCRIFGPRTPPPVAPWWDTSSRRPRTGSRTPKSQNR
jgi:hypothetical protein